MNSKPYVQDTSGQMLFFFHVNPTVFLLCNCSASCGAMFPMPRGKLSAMLKGLIISQVCEKNIVQKKKNVNHVQLDCFV